MNEKGAILSSTQEELDQKREKEAMGLIEAILFVSGRFLDMKDLIMFSDMNPIIIRELMEKLQESYDEKSSALQIIEKNGMWKMDVKQEFSGIVNRLAGGNSEFTKAEQETLAIIAYKQPIKQSVIIKIRGNKAYDHIKRFLDLELIDKKRAGRTWELNLSPEFYDYFSVSNPDKKSVEEK